MMNMTGPDLLSILESLRKDKAGIDWFAMWQDDEEFEEYLDLLDDLIQFSVMVFPGTNLQETQQFVGKITIAKVQLATLKEQENEVQAFTIVGQALEQDIKDMLSSSPIVKNITHILQNSVEPIEDMLSEDADPSVANALLFVLSSLPLLLSEENCQEETCEETH